MQPKRLIIWPKGSIYREKRIEPRIDPCGTPYDSGADGDTKLPMETKKRLFDRYETNHSRSFPEIPTQFFKWLMRMLWSMVSKAALMSSKTKMECSPLSACIRMSLVTLNKAVLVLCLWRKPDWNLVLTLLSSKDSSNSTDHNLDISCCLLPINPYPTMIVTGNSVCVLCYETTRNRQKTSKCYLT